MLLKPMISMTSMLMVTSTRNASSRPKPRSRKSLPTCASTGELLGSSVPPPSKKGTRRTKFAIRSVKVWLIIVKDCVAEIATEAAVPVSSVCGTEET